MIGTLNALRRVRRPSRLGSLSLLAGLCVAASLAPTAGAQCPTYNPPQQGSGENGGPGGPGPSGPTFPGPSGPTTPGPQVPGPGSPGPAPTTGGPIPRGPAPAPTTGGPSGPRLGAPGARGPTGARGIPLVFTRGTTSKSMLTIDWDYPVYVPEEVQDGRTRAQRARALPTDEAYRTVASDDRRPLLVLRECLNCKGSDLALLSERFNNERTVLLTGFFHCIKLPSHVALDDHPFHNLFPAESSDHLFLAGFDGSERIDLTGRQSQSQLWKAMTSLLRKNYDGDANANVKKLMKLLNDFDRIDAKEQRLLADLDEVLETKGPSSSKVHKLQAKLKKLQDDKAELRDLQKALSKLDLRAPADAIVGMDK